MNTYKKILKLTDLLECFNQKHYDKKTFHFMGIQIGVSMEKIILNSFNVTDKRYLCDRKKMFILIIVWTFGSKYLNL